jgi:hypothetical protein
MRQPPQQHGSVRRSAAQAHAIIAGDFLVAGTALLKRLHALAFHRARPPQAAPQPPSLRQLVFRT